MSLNLAARALGSVALLACLLETGCTKFASDLDAIADSPDTQTLELGPGDWSCVSEAAGNPVMNPNAAPLDLPIQVRDYITGIVPTELRIRACFRADVACSQPATDWLEPDETGLFTLPLSEGFSGYLEITARDEIPALYVLPAPLTPELVQTLQSVAIALLPPDALLAFGQVSQLELDPGAGILSINTFDCTGPAAPGVRLELNAAAVPFSFIDGLPVAFEDTTTDDGTAGFANVVPGLAVVKGFRAASMDLVGVETVLVRAGWVSISNLMPQYAGTF
jgi:hypothetical protein